MENKTNAFSLKVNIITVVSFLVLLFGFAALFVILPDKDYSDTENRALQTFPEFNLETLTDGSFSKEINMYFADQFPFRDAFVSAKALAELSLLKGENNGVLLGDDGVIADRLHSSPLGGESDKHISSFVAPQLEALNTFAAAQSIPVHAVIPPRTVDIYADKFSYPTDYSANLLKELRGVSADVLVPVYDMLLSKQTAGEYVYYRTDHHWTTLGAYYSYVEIMKSFGMEKDIISKDKFTAETVSNAFYGTTWCSSGLSFVDPDRMELWLLGNEQEFTVTVPNAFGSAQALSGLYDLSYLETTNKYACFLSTGLYDVIEIKKTSDTARPTLLLPKDSFANCLAPFLAQHFDLVIVNLDGTNLTSVADYINKYSPDRVLIVWNLDNLISKDTLGTQLSRQPKPIA